MSLLPIPESPQLSSPLSTSEHDQTNVVLGPDCYNRLCVEPLDGEGDRPVSLVSTLSSGSSRDSHSLFGSTVALPSSNTPPIPSEEDIDLELSPTEGTGEQAGDQSPTLTGSRGRWQERNNNNATSNRKASGEIPHITASPVVTDAMAPNPKLSYVDRVVMEIIETERMYVRDLRSIVEVSECQDYADWLKLNFPLQLVFFTCSPVFTVSQPSDVIESKSSVFCVFKAHVWLGLIYSYDFMSVALFGVDLLYWLARAKIRELGLMAVERK